MLQIERIAGTGPFSERLTGFSESMKSALDPHALPKLEQNNEYDIEDL